jgi:hypothetical protein
MVFQPFDVDGRQTVVANKAPEQCHLLALHGVNLL